jgi:predicted transcriptional regulator
MSLATTKLQLVQRLLETEDKDVIKYIKALFDSHEGSWYDELPDAVKKSVDKGLEDAKNGKLTPHKEVMKKYRKWLKK